MILSQPSEGKLVALEDDRSHRGRACDLCLSIFNTTNVEPMNQREKANELARKTAAFGKSRTSENSKS